MLCGKKGYVLFDIILEIKSVDDFGPVALSPVISGGQSIQIS